MKIAFIGMTLKDTPTLGRAVGHPGLRFLDEIATANALVPILKGQGVEAMVVLIHEGGTPSSIADINGCAGISGPILNIQNGLDPEIDAIVTGHTHLPYNCVMIDPAGQDRRVTSAYSFGRVVSEIDLVLDKRTPRRAARPRDGDEPSRHADRAKDPAQTAVLAKWRPAGRRRRQRAGRRDHRHDRARRPALPTTAPSSRTSGTWSRTPSSSPPRSTGRISP